MPGMAGRLLRGAVFLLLLGMGVIAIEKVLGGLALGVYTETPIVFLFTKLAGDGLRTLVYGRSNDFIMADFIRDLIVFGGIGLVAAAAIDVAAQVTGGSVSPVGPAIGGYLIYRL